MKKIVSALVASLIACASNAGMNPRAPSPAPAASAMTTEAASQATPPKAAVVEKPAPLVTTPPKQVTAPIQTKTVAKPKAPEPKKPSTIQEQPPFTNSAPQQAAQPVPAPTTATNAILDATAKLQQEISALEPMEQSSNADQLKIVSASDLALSKTLRGSIKELTKVNFYNVNDGKLDTKNSPKSVVPVFLDMWLPGNHLGNTSPAGVNAEVLLSIFQYLTARKEPITLIVIPVKDSASQMELELTLSSNKDANPYLKNLKYVVTREYPMVGIFSSQNELNRPIFSLGFLRTAKGTGPNVEELCPGRNVISRSWCEAESCRQNENYYHPTCIKLR